MNVLTSAYDNTRTGANLSETLLSTTTVTPAAFGRLFALPVDSEVYGQPLYVSHLTMQGGRTHNVLFVATMHNSVYAFDADVWNGEPLWVTSLGTPVPPGVYRTKDVYETGVLSTPAIDLETQTMYVVSDNDNDGVLSYELHAIDLTSGAEKQNTPMIISGSVTGSGDGSVSGTLTFDPTQHLQRPGLLLSNGTVYVAFGSYADTPPYHGWIFSFNAANIHQQLGIFCSTPNGAGAAIWQAGRGLAADTQGNVYAATGNGDFDGISSFGESVVRLTPDLQLSDWFAPDSWLLYNQKDYDLGSSGIVLIPGTNSLVSAGKSGTAFVLTSDNLGHTQAGNGQAQQTLATQSGIIGTAVWDGPGGPVMYVQNSYYAAVGYRMLSGRFETNASLISSNITGTAYDGITVSSSGQTAGSGIVWVTTAPAYGSAEPGTLTALDAMDLTKVLWTSANNPDDAMGYFAKFAMPTVANGKVYVPTFSHQILVYGIRSTAVSVPTVLAVTNAASYSSGAVAPGEIITVFGTGLSGEQLFLQPVDANGLGTTANGTQIAFDDIPAPIIYTTALSVSAIVPLGLQNPTVAIRAVYQGQESAPLIANVAAAAPGIFTLDSTGTHQGAFLNQDLTINSASNPASPGDVLVVYTTGEGELTTDLPDGSLAPEPEGPGDDDLVVQPVIVQIGGIPCDVLYAGAAPGSVVGLIQINVRIPEGVPPGDAAVTIQMGDTISQGGVTAAIR